MTTEKQKEQARLRKQRQRDKESVTSNSVTSPSMTLDEGQRLHPRAAPGATILSDGQLWYPGSNGYHPKECLCGVHGDRR